MSGLGWAVEAAAMEAVVQALVAEVEGVWPGWESLKKKAHRARSRMVPSDRRLANVPLTSYQTLFTTDLQSTDVAFVIYWQVFVILLFVTLRNNVLKGNNVKQTSIISGWSVILRWCYRATVLQETANVQIRVCGLK